jgi:anti-anti-sigma factor
MPPSKGSRAPVLLRLSRALTGATVLRVQRQLTAALHGHPPCVVLDLSGVHDCDAAGATLLYAFASVAADRGGEVRLANVPTPILATLAHSGLFDIAAAFTTVTGARAGDRTAQVAGQPDQRPAWAAASTLPP